MFCFFKHSVVLYWELTEVGRTDQAYDLILFLKMC